MCDATTDAIRWRKSVGIVDVTDGFVLCNDRRDNALYLAILLNRTALQVSNRMQVFLPVKDTVRPSSSKSRCPSSMLVLRVWCLTRVLSYIQDAALVNATKKKHYCPARGRSQGGRCKTDLDKQGCDDGSASEGSTVAAGIEGLRGTVDH